MPLQITQVIQTISSCILRETMRRFVQMREGERYGSDPSYSDHSRGALSSKCSLLDLSSDFLLLPVLEDSCPPRTLAHKGSTLVKPGNKSVSSKYEVDNINFSILVQTIGIILFLTIALAPHKRPYHCCHLSCFTIAVLKEDGCLPKELFF